MFNSQLEAFIYFFFIGMIVLSTGCAVYLSMVRPGDTDES